MAQYPSKLGGRDIKQALERIDDNIMWIKRNEDSIDSFLSGR